MENSKFSFLKEGGTGVPPVIVPSRRSAATRHQLPATRHGRLAATLSSISYLQTSGRSTASFAIRYQSSAIGRAAASLSAFQHFRVSAFCL